LLSGVRSEQDVREALNIVFSAFQALFQVKEKYEEEEKQ